MARCAPDRPRLKYRPAAVSALFSGPPDLRSKRSATIWDARGRAAAVYKRAPRASCRALPLASPLAALAGLWARGALPCGQGRRRPCSLQRGGVLDG
eukprot:scaffold1135_cov343-Prasinococcus_capsulatus_cf.AAC.5